ncbi:hypothetical protein NPIL_457691, partial [Nephila pilipes]
SSNKSISAPIDFFEVENDALRTDVFVGIRPGKRVLIGSIAGR